MGDFMTPHQEFLRRIADEVGLAERNFQRAIGATWTAAYQADWNVWHEVHDIARQPDRPLVTMGLREIRT
jgi:hypothetical protein